MNKERSIEFNGTGLQALGWSLYYGFLAIFIIPAAWGAVSLCRWLIRNLSFDDGTRVSFEGQGGQVWYYFALSMLIGYVPLLSRMAKDPEISPYLGYGLSILILPISAAIGLRIMRWFFANTRFSDGTNLKFKGNYSPYLGWLLLNSLSALTIIGWAWVAVAFLRWVCRNVDAGDTEIEFQGNGWELLWRTVLAILASFLIVPIPWVWLWVLKWMLNNLILTSKSSLVQEKINGKIVFFSYSHEDAFRAEIVTKYWGSQEDEARGFIDDLRYADLIKNGDEAIKNWIDDQLHGTSATVVLVAKETCRDKWVKYGIEKSIEKGNRLLGIDVSKIKDQDGNKSDRCGKIPAGYPFYLWNKENGRENLGQWIKTSLQNKNNSSLTTKEQILAGNCPGCGKPIEPSWPYCGYCGQSLIHDENISSQPVLFPPVINQIPEGKLETLEPSQVLHNASWKWLIGGIGILLIALIVLFFVFRKPTPSVVESPEKMAIIPTSTQSYISTDLPVSIPTSNIDDSQVTIPAEELARANEVFEDGALVYLYDPQPTTIPLSYLDSTQFSVRYILSKETSEVTNILLLWKTNTDGVRQFIIPETNTALSQTVALGNWSNETGIITFSTFSRMADTSNQQGIDPNTAVFTTWVITWDSVTPLYASPNLLVTDPVYLDVLLLAPDEDNGNLLISELSRQISNTVRIAITP